MKDEDFGGVSVGEVCLDESCSEQRLFLVGGAATANKLRQRDLAGIEHNVGKPSDEMAEKELTTAMKKLGVQPQELTEREQSSITESMTGSQSPYCEVLVKKGD